jgi:hypothetical protein
MWPSVFADWSLTLLKIARQEREGLSALALFVFGDELLACCPVFLLEVQGGL